MEKGSAIKIVIVIAIIVIALLYLTRPEPVDTASIGTTCSIQQMYQCRFPIYYHATGNLTIALEQNTGSNWSIVSLIFVPQNVSYSNGIPEIYWNSTTTETIIGGMPSGTFVNATLPISGPVNYGTKCTGFIWAKYQLTSGGTVEYTELTQVNAIAV